MRNRARIRLVCPGNVPIPSLEHTKPASRRYFYHYLEVKELWFQKIYLFISTSLSCQNFSTSSTNGFVRFLLSDSPYIKQSKKLALYALPCTSRSHKATEYTAFCMFPSIQYISPVKPDSPHQMLSTLFSIVRLSLEGVLFRLFAIVPLKQNLMAVLSYLAFR